MQSAVSVILYTVANHKGRSHAYVKTLATTRMQSAVNVSFYTVANHKGRLPPTKSSIPSPSTASRPFFVCSSFAVGLCERPRGVGNRKAAALSTETSCDIEFQANIAFQTNTLTSTPLATYILNKYIIFLLRAPAVLAAAASLGAAAALLSLRDSERVRRPLYIIISLSLSISLSLYMWSIDSSVGRIML